MRGFIRWKEDLSKCKGRLVQDNENENMGGFCMRDIDMYNIVCYITDISALDISALIMYVHAHLRHEG